MLSNNTDFDENIESIPKKKIKLQKKDSKESLEKDDSSHSIILNENRNNVVVEGSQNDDNEIDNHFDYTSNTINDNHSVSSEESNSDNGFTVNKYVDSESDEYVPISDGEFELEKCVINDKTNSKSNEKSNDDKSIDDNDNTDDIRSKNNKSSCIDNDEVYDLLDKAYQDKNSNPNENKKKTVTQEDFKEYEKIVLEEVCKNHFDILPENWIEATHKSGMPIYLHKKSRVVTLSRPYFLGPGDPRSHLAPLSAISCLQYQKGLESKENIKNEPDFQVSKLGDMIIPNAKVETAQENIIKESLTHEELREYCQSLFK